MAKARRIQETVVSRRKIDRIQLTLTEGEADMLIAIMSRIGGHRHDSPRKYAVRIARALKEATGLNYTETDAHKLMSWFAHIAFNNYEDPAGGRSVTPQR